MYQENQYCDCDCNRQKHVHEFLGSVKIAGSVPHTHRFAGVTGEAIMLPNRNHFHKLETSTDFAVEHFHVICDRTGPAKPVGEGRHVHFAEGQTTVDAGHSHEYIFATLIEDPTGD